jgi:hypothetical protein
MASYKNFQFDNKKYDNPSARTDITNKQFNPTINARGYDEQNSITDNIEKWKNLISWCRWNPDLFWDLITPEMGGIRLDLDQRVQLRCLSRFISTYSVFNRGYGKTLLEVMALYHTAIFFPDIELSMTAQTKENAAKIFDEKHREILRFYPLLKDEIVKSTYSKDTFEVVFTSGGRVDVMANAQTSKGARRKRINIEEAALLNNKLFQDVLEPIVNVPRRTIGREAMIDPEELNGSINFFSTSGFRGSDEFARSLSMVDDMSILKGKMVLGSDWQLACAYGRGETKSQILDKKATLSPIFFAMNYESKWVGAVDNALVDINKVLALRSLAQSELVGAPDGEYILGIDVARSVVTGNNQSSVVVMKIKRNKNNRVGHILLVNLFTLSNILNFTAQAVEIKKIKRRFHARMVIVDSNGLGIGLVDELMKESFDINTGESLGCWNTVNTDSIAEMTSAENCLYDLKPQSANSDIIVSFIDMIESGKLRLLEKRPDTGYDANDQDNYIKNVMPYIHTDFLIEEISNLQLKTLPNGKVTVVRVIAKVGKDRFSALAYALWYIKTFEDNNYQEEEDVLKLLLSYTYV